MAAARPRAAAVLLLDHRQVGLDENPAIEAGDRRASSSGSISIAMPRGGRPLVMAKAMPARCNALHGRLRALRQHLVSRDERAVDIGQHQRDLGRFDLSSGPPSPSIGRRAASCAVTRQKFVGRGRARASGGVDWENPSVDCSPRHRGSAARRANRPRCCRRAGTASSRRSCNRRSAFHSRCWGHLKYPCS